MIPYNMQVSLQDAQENSEIAYAYYMRIIVDAADAGCSQREIAEILGKSPSWVARTLKSLGVKYEKKIVKT